MAFITFFEVLAVVLITAGILFEPRVALAERRVLHRLRRWIRRIRHQRELRQYALRHSPVCSALQGYARRRL